MDSFSHMPSQNIFKIGFSLLLNMEYQRQTSETKKKLAKSNNFGSKLFPLFKLRKHMPILDIFSKIKEIWAFEVLNHCCTSQLKLSYNFNRMS